MPFTNIGPFIEAIFSNTAAALIILLLGLLAGRIFGKFTKKILNELQVNKVLRESGTKLPVEEFMGSFVTYIVYFITFILALQQIGLTTTLFYIILIILFLIIAVILILALKDFVPNVIASFFIHQKSMLKKGEMIKVDEIEGRIKNIALVETQIVTKAGDTIYIPNSLLLKGKLVKLRTNHK